MIKNYTTKPVLFLLTLNMYLSTEHICDIWPSHPLIWLLLQGKILVNVAHHSRMFTTLHDMIHHQLQLMATGKNYSQRLNDCSNINIINYEYYKYNTINHFITAIIWRSTWEFNLFVLSHSCFRGFLKKFINVRLGVQKIKYSENNEWNVINHSLLIFSAREEDIMFCK